LWQGFTGTGATARHLAVRHVICLSTIPPRFAAIGTSLRSLVGQRSRPEAVELYIPKAYRRFPEWGGALPEVPEGVRIVRSDQDFGPATKILPAARAYLGQEVELLYADDDHLADPDWAEGFLKVRAMHPEAAVCAAAYSLGRMGRPWSGPDRRPHALIAPRMREQPRFLLQELVSLFGARVRGRARPKLQSKYRKVDRSGYADIAGGFSGVAVRPEFFEGAAFDIPSVLWAVDDIWLSGHLARRGIPIWADAALNRVQAINLPHLTEPLFKAVIDGTGRAQANRACIDHMRATYGIWGGAADQST
jgi:hypothetical protein